MLFLMYNKRIGENMKLKDKELWLELYEIAEKIQKLEPWKYLWDMDLLVYLCQPLNEVFYCSVMGHGMKELY